MHGSRRESCGLFSHHFFQKNPGLRRDSKGHRSWETWWTPVRGISGEGVESFRTHFERDAVSGFDPGPAAYPTQAILRKSTDIRGGIHIRSPFPGIGKFHSLDRPSEKSSRSGVSGGFLPPGKGWVLSSLSRSEIPGGICRVQDERRKILT